MTGGSGAGGESYFDAASGTHHGPGSPQGGRRSDAASGVEQRTGRARLRLALVLLAVVVVLVVLLLVL